MPVKWAELGIAIGTGIVCARMLKAAFADVHKSVDKLKGARCPGDDPNCKIVPAGEEIEQRAKYVAQMSWESSLDPVIKSLAMQTLNKKCDGQWCTPPRKLHAEVKSLTTAVYENDPDVWGPVEGHFAWVKENVAYRKDHAYVDQFPSARRTATEYHGEDCDGHVILINALNLTVGYPVGMRIYQTVNGQDWDHIAALVEIEGRWYVLDASVDKIRENGKVKAIRPGWGAPKAMIRKFVDFKILPYGKIEKIGSTSY